MNALLVAVHAGAGGVGSAAVSEAERSRAALAESVAAARAVLEPGGDAVAAVAAAVMVLESFELFNAGYGSVLCADGTVELSAAIMRSGDRAAGAVAGVRRTRHPILAAEAVMRSPQVLLVGEPADALAAQVGLEQVSPEWFVTERQRRRRALGKTVAGADHNTVGAVCRDATGALAAGTSTGGIRGQAPGRVGDCPLIGAGTWADARVAVSCTGDGEAFIRAGVARHIATLHEGGLELEAACARALADVQALGGDGGLIAIDAGGVAALPFVTEVMPRGLWRTGREPEIWVA